MVVVLSHIGSNLWCGHTPIPCHPVQCKKCNNWLHYCCLRGDFNWRGENCLFQVCVLRSQNPTSEAAPQLQPTQQIRQQCSPPPHQENLFTIVVLGRHQQQHQEQQLHRFRSFQQLFVVGRCDSSCFLRRTTAAALFGVQLLVQRPSPQGVLQPVGIVVKPVIRIWYDLCTEKNTLRMLKILIDLYWFQVFRQSLQAARLALVQSSRLCSILTLFQTFKTVTSTPPSPSQLWVAINPIAMNYNL